MKYTDQEEKEFIESYNRGEWRSIEDKKELSKYVEAAKVSLNKNKRINIRLTSKDLNDIQVKAIAEGIPYQTLISSLIHKYNAGKLVEKK